MHDGPQVRPTSPVKLTNKVKTHNNMITEIQTSPIGQPVAKVRRAEAPTLPYQISPTELVLPVCDARVAIALHMLFNDTDVLDRLALVTSQCRSVDGGDAHQHREWWGDLAQSVRNMMVDTLIQNGHHKRQLDLTLNVGSLRCGKLLANDNSNDLADTVQRALGYDDRC